MPDMTKEREALIKRLHAESQMWRGNGDENLSRLLDEAAAALSTPAQTTPETINE